MIINQKSLLELAPIKNMLDHKVQAKPTSYGLTECGYDIRIKENVRFYGPTYHITGNLIGPEEYSLFDPKEHHNSFIPKLNKGRFALASSIEEFDMPTNLMGRVLNKSTWARKGLDASLTTNIEPGWKGFLTIELVYHGQEDLYIPAGSGICQIIFETLAHEAQYVGKYQNQENRPIEAK